MESVPEVWDGDLLNRRPEAEALIGYLESVVTRPPMRDEGHAHVLAVDCSYGQGKSFFLRRLARHMRATEHSVAFVDAWVDDLEDQPMVALVATLQKALEPWIKSDPTLAEAAAAFLAKVGRVAKIAGVGVAKRAASFVIMGSGAEALGAEISGAGDVVRDLTKDTLKEGSTDLVDAAAEGFGAGMASSMEHRIERFREGQQAIVDMKAALQEIVTKLVEAGVKLPITIIIDELDRCRPTYAIKVLEEVKHLFDVPGLAFILGLHGEQLAHSVTAAYGAGFNGQAYLRRFFNRRYVLKEAALTPLVAKLARDLAIPLERLIAPQISMEEDGRSPKDPQATALIADYIDAYGLAARDAFGCMEVLQTAMALTGSGQVILPLIIPMIIAQVQNIPLGNLHLERPPVWKYVTDNETGGITRRNTHTLDVFFNEAYSAAKLSKRALTNVMNDGNPSGGTIMVAEVKLNGPNGDFLHDPSRYDEVLGTVARFVSVDPLRGS